MARFSLVFAAAGVLLVVAMAVVAEAFTETVFTTTTFEDNTRGTGGTGSGCYQRVMDQDMLNHCGMYIIKVIEGKSQWSPRTRGQEEDHMQLCCMQLKNVGEDCMCPGIKMMMNQQTSGMMGDMTRQMMSMARNLPTQCNLSSQPCQMRAVWF